MSINGQTQGREGKAWAEFQVCNACLPAAPASCAAWRGHRTPKPPGNNSNKYLNYPNPTFFHATRIDDSQEHQDATVC